MELDARVAADCFIFDTAVLRHALAVIEAGTDAGERAKAATLLNHIAQRQRDYAVALTGDGLPGDSPELDGALAATLTPLVKGLSLVNATGLSEPAPSALFPVLAGWPLAYAIRRWSAHARSHAPSLFAAAPSLEGDPLVRNWLLGLDFPADEAARTLQATLRERYPRTPGSDD